MTTEPSNDFTLYGHPRSGNCYKPALMLALTNTPFKFRWTDLPGREQRTDEFRKKNPWGKLPVLEHGDLTIRQSNTMLLHLAAQTRQFNAADARERLRVSEWLFWEQDQFLLGVGYTRAFSTFAPQPEPVVDFCRGVGEIALDSMQPQLDKTEFLAGSNPSIADIAVYAYARVAEAGGFDVAARPAVQRWRDAIEALPGWATPENLMPEH